MAVPLTLALVGSNVSSGNPRLSLKRRCCCSSSENSTLLSDELSLPPSPDLYLESLSCFDEVPSFLRDFDIPES